jgi:rRNA maturation endonuclease Nob1
MPPAPKEHRVTYRLRCVKCSHVWEDGSGWLPAVCPSCGNRIEHGDHLPAHLEILDVRLEATS